MNNKTYINKTMNEKDKKIYYFNKFADNLFEIIDSTSQINKNKKGDH